MLAAVLGIGLWVSLVDISTRRVPNKWTYSLLSIGLIGQGFMLVTEVTHTHTFGWRFWHQSHHCYGAYGDQILGAWRWQALLGHCARSTAFIMSHFSSLFATKCRTSFAHQYPFYLSPL